jgi:hypothetical protein
LRQKCEGYRAETTPFRKHGKKAYIVGYFRGCCDKKALLAPGTNLNPLEFLPLIEIVKIDWAAGEPRQLAPPRDLPVTPSRGDVAGRGKGRFVFDPLSQMGGETDGVSTPSKSGVYLMVYIFL